MHNLKSIIAIIVGVLLAAPPFAFGNSHREAPITSLDHHADITDFYAFISYDDASKVTFIMNVDPFQENGSNYFPFDPNVIYCIKVDNNQDAAGDITFEFRFQTEIRAPGLRQVYKVTMLRGAGDTATRTDLTPSSQKLIAVPSNAVAKHGIYSLGSGVRVFAGTIDDPMFMELGGAFKVNTIAIEVPASMITVRGSPAVGASAATYRARITVRSTAGSRDTGELVPIQRLASPVLHDSVKDRAGPVADLLRLATGVQPNSQREHRPGGSVNTDSRIAEYQLAAKSDPASLEKQNSLAAAYIQKLRETGDGSYLDRAGKILDGVLARDGRNYEALHLRNEIALNLHEFAAVAEQSRKLAAISPQDPRNWGTLGDALMEMGEYDQAADAYQQMVNARPGLSSYNRVAFYRFVTGDAEGAIALMKNAIGAGSRVPENLAWCLVDLGWMYFKTGKMEEAAAAFGNALRVFPGYHRAYAGMGQVLAAFDRIPEAIESYRQAQAVVPLPEYAAALAELHAIGGKELEGKKQQALLDMLDQIGQAKGETTNRNLSLAYADQDRKLDRAVQLAQAELNSRGDVYTYDALAWALYKNGRYAEAETDSAKALRMKTAEPAFYYHAGMIAAALGNRAEAKARLEQALALNPRFDVRQACIAAKTVAELGR